MVEFKIGNIVRMKSIDDSTPFMTVINVYNNGSSRVYLWDPEQRQFSDFLFQNDALILVRV